MQEQYSAFDDIELLKAPVLPASLLLAPIQESEGDSSFIKKASEIIARAKLTSQIAPEMGQPRYNYYKGLTGEKPECLHDPEGQLYFWPHVECK
jgi:DNA-binding phage protein